MLKRFANPVACLYPWDPCMVYLCVFTFTFRWEFMVLVNVGKYTAHGSYRMFSHRSMIRNPAAGKTLKSPPNQRIGNLIDSLVLGEASWTGTHFVQQRYGNFESKLLISTWVQTVVIGSKNWKVLIDLSLICWRVEDVGINSSTNSFAPENGLFQKGKVMIPSHPFSVFKGRKCFRFREGYTKVQSWFEVFFWTSSKHVFLLGRGFLPNPKPEVGQWTCRYFRRRVVLIERNESVSPFWEQNTKKDVVLHKK